MRAGRPKLPKNQKRNAMLHIRLTQAEYKALRRAAETDGLGNVSDFARDLILKGIKPHGA